jgi:hypothetical protein
MPASIFEPVCLETVTCRVLHEAERPARFGMWLCDCHACRVVLEATGRVIDNTYVVIKYGMAPRPVVHWRDYCDVNERFHRGEEPDPYLMWSEYPDDWVREVFVARGTGAPVCDCTTDRCREGRSFDTLGRGGDHGRR